MFETLRMYFQYPFVRYALIVGVLIALCSSLLGVTLVLKRFSFIGDGLSHVAFGAMAIASVLNITNNMLFILPVTVICAILLLRAGQNTRIKGDAAIAMISVGALAIGYLLMNLFSTSPNISGDVCSTLFGSTSILTLTKGEVWLCAILSIVVVAIFILFYNKIFAVTFDENFAKATGTRANAYNLLIAVVIAVIIVLVLAICSFHIIPTGYTGVKTSFGQIQETTIQSGKLNFCIPFVQSIHKVNNKQQDKHIEAQIWGEASDKTPVYAADVIVTYQVLPEKSAWLYANVSDIKNLVGDELVASAIKSAMAELGPNEVTNRTKIEPLAQQKLAESLVQKYGEDVVFVNKVVINDMNFEDAYNEAIQQKSIAQQNADKQKIENEAAIAKAEADKQVAITNAEAEAQKTSIAADAQAEANRKLAESLSDTLIEYQKIQKWDGKLPTVSGSTALVSIDPAE